MTGKIQILVALLAVVAGIYDIRYRRIPNWLVLPAIPLGFALGAFLDPWQGLWNSLLGFGLAVLIYLPMYALRGMGAGDVKLAAALGALAGWTDWLRILLFSALVGLALALALMLLRRRFRKTLSNTAYIVWDLVHLRPPYQRSEELDVQSPKGTRLPHGAVLALGTLALLGVRAFH